jgi:hypothetical protein
VQAGRQPAVWQKANQQEGSIFRNFLKGLLVSYINSLVHNFFEEKCAMPKPALFLLIAALLLSSCAAASQPQSALNDAYRGAVEGVMEYEAAPGAPMESPSKSYGESYTSSTAQDTQRIVIKNADLVLVVDDPAKSMETISQMADQMGGYVVSAQLYQRRLESGAEVPQASVTVRVPVARLDEAINRIESESQRPPINKNMGSQDVTRDYVDLQSRLRNLEAAEIQLQQIMLEAKRTDDVLMVYNELTRTREQIEVIKGQIQYYEQASSLSSISVSLMPNEAVQPITIGGWEPQGVAKNAIQALVNSLTTLANTGIWTVLFLLPLLIVLALPLVVLVLIWRRFRRRPKGPSMPASPAV